MNKYIDQKIIPLGKIEGELVRESNPMRPVNNGETVLTFGRYRGYAIEHVNKFDHSYIVYLATIKRFRNKVTKAIVDVAIKLTTPEEREDKTERKDYFNKKNNEIKWLTEFLKGVVQNQTSWSRFAYSIYNRLQSEHRIDLLSINQLKCIANMWAEIKSENTDGKEYLRYREEFKRKMKPYWKRKYNSIEEV